MKKLILFLILLFSTTLLSQTRETYERYVGYQVGKYPMTLAGLQAAINALPNDSGIVYIAYPGVDSAGVGAIPTNISLRGWLFIDGGPVNIELAGIGLSFTADEIDSLLTLVATGVNSDFSVNEMDSILALADTLLQALKGGTTNQVLAKNSNADYDFKFVTLQNGSIPADTLPSQFTFSDVSSASLNSYHTAYIVVAGCDSARFYPASGDTIRPGLLGVKTVSPIWLDNADTLYTFCVASGTNSTSTTSIVSSSSGTPVDTFTVTTVAASGSHVTDSLKSFWLFTDKTNGRINSTDSLWASSVGSQSLKGYSATYFPIKRDTGVVYVDGDEWLYTESKPYYASYMQETFSVGIVVQIPDTLGQYVLAGIETEAPEALMHHTLGVNQDAGNWSGRSFITGYYYTAGDGEHKDEVYFPPAIRGKSVYIVLTSDNAGNQTIYINAVSQANIHTSDAITVGESRIFVGTQNYTLKANSVVKAVEFYNKTLTQGEIDANQAYYEGLGWID